MKKKNQNGMKALVKKYAFFIAGTAIVLMVLIIAPALSNLSIFKSDVLSDQGITPLPPFTGGPALSPQEAMNAFFDSASDAIDHEAELKEKRNEEGRKAQEQEKKRKEEELKECKANERKYERLNFSIKDLQFDRELLRQEEYKLATSIKGDQKANDKIRAQIAALNSQREQLDAKIVKNAAELADLFITLNNLGCDIPPEQLNLNFGLQG